jgi:hypothetical protein
MAHKPNSARGDWEKQVRFDMAFAERMLLKQGDVGRMFVMHAKDAQHVMAAPWKGNDEKARILTMVRAYCIAYDAEALSFISEAWIRHLDRAPGETEAEFRARSNAIRPSEAEDRREVVMVVIMYRDAAGERQIVSDTREITRRDNGKPDGLTPYRMNEGMDMLSGGIIETFPRWPASPEQRDLARIALGIR